MLNIGDTVRVLPTHYGTGLQTEKGIILRFTPGGYIEVVMSKLKQIVAFVPTDLDLVKTIDKKEAS